MQLIKTRKTTTITKIYKHDTLPINVAEIDCNGKISYSYELNKKFIHSVVPKLIIPSDKFWLQKGNVTLTSLEDIDKYTLYLWDCSGDIWFDYNMNVVSTPFTFDYCSHHVRERYSNDKDFEKIIDWIKNNPIYADIKIGEIEYYNADFDGQKALKLATVFPRQEQYEKIYNLVKDKEYYSVKLRDCFRFGYDMFKYNPFNEKTMKMLKEFYGREM